MLVHEKEGIPLFQSILCSQAEYVLAQLMSRDGRFFLEILKGGKKKGAVKISLYINCARIETFILKNGSRIRYAASREGLYALRPEGSGDSLQFSISNESKSFNKRRSEHHPD